jgi:hypothetical protein
MTPANRDGLLTLIVDVVENCSYPQISQMVQGVGHALGGTTMTSENRSGLLAGILASHATCTAEQLENMTLGVGLALGGASMTTENRDAMLTQVHAARGRCSNSQTGLMVRAIAMPVARPVTPERRSALLSQVLATHSTITPLMIGTLVCSLVTHAKGEKINADSCNGLIRQILAGAETYSDAHVAGMIWAAGMGLGGVAMTEANRSGLLTQILAARATCNPNKVGMMILGAGQALGGRLMTAGHRTAWLTQILATHRTWSVDERTQIIWNVAKALGGESITPESYNVLLTHILGMHATCNPEQMRRMIFIVALSIMGRRGKPLTTVTAVLTQILGAHSTCTPQQMAEMVGLFAKRMPVETLLKSIFQAGASPVKTGMMIASVIAKQKLAPERANALFLLDDALLLEIERHDPERANSLRPYVQAAHYAGTNDIARLLALQGMEDDQKLNFIEYTYSTLHPPGATGLAAQFGMITTLDLASSLRVRALAILLKEAPKNASTIEMVRQCLLGRFAEIGDIEGTGAEKFASWYVDFRDFYNSISKHMTLEWVVAEKALIAGITILPGSVRASIGALLTARQAELTPLPGLEGGL